MAAVTPSRQDRDTERRYLVGQGFTEPVVTRLINEFGGLFEAADRAIEDSAALVEINGVGPETVQELASLSPLTVAGEWSVDKLGTAHYRFEADGVSIAMLPVDDGCEATLLSRAEGSLLKGYSLEQQQCDRLSAWWACKRVIDANPAGIDSPVPQNVETPPLWFLYANEYSKSGTRRACWENEKSRERLTVAPADGDGDPFEVRRKPNLISQSEVVETGTWAALLDHVEQRMADTWE